MEQIFKIGAVSAASKGKRILSDHGYRARLTKTDDASEGCAWGLAVSGKDAEAATRILRAAGVRYELL